MRGAAARLHRKAQPGYYIETYGCQMNEHDSEVVAGILERMGYRRARKLEDADLILFNTCAIREHAVERVLGRMGELKRLKYVRPETIIGVGGCLPQQDGAVERIRRRAPHLDLIFGTHNVYRLPELLASVQTSEYPVIEVWEGEGEGEIVENLPAARPQGVKAWVTIAYGCDKKCTYCVVPYTRGKERSRRPGDIVAEVRGLVAQGYKEITLLGQNVNSYGKDFAPAGYDFGDLVRDLDQIQGLQRVRFMTSHPRDFNQKMVDAIAQSRVACKQFHLPVQSGNNRTLKRMLRGYTRETYLDLVRRVREAVPDAVVTTDIIVGFPGETEEEFQDTLSLIREAEFDSAYTFTYSVRQGTPAERMKDQVPEDVKKDRLNRLMEVQNRVSRAKMDAVVGKAVEVLVEGPSDKNERVLSGRDLGGRLVLFEGPASLIGQLVPVRVTEARTWTLHGERDEAGEPQPARRRGCRHERGTRGPSDPGRGT
ncbi:MAG: tRNA (N6-isopentenyl adenosine(37)-C2)-methylthiotransferase MiaB [Firmicutes bacterium]|nr:tRNA (N6-isopentenyl adenosine(37)-C2)-methylthiotransferase MiaB [Bacillota bacterium]